MGWNCVAVLALLVVLVEFYETGAEDPMASVMVNPRKVINHIAREFVCFSAKPRSVFEDSLNPVSETTFQMAKKLSPMYMKVYGDSSQLELQMDGFVVKEDDSELVQITPNGWRAFDRWAQEAGLVPVFVLDYGEHSWKPRNALKVLTVANKLGITNCLWQLGVGNITNAVKYIEDLRAFRAITKAFKYKGIVACDVDPLTVGVDQTRYFNLNVDELADAVSVIYNPSVANSRLKEFVLQRESYVKGPARSHLPIWLDARATPTATSSGESCDEHCLWSGLHYATLLGDAARNGFNTVFKELSRQEVKSYSLAYLIALLHKSTVGTKVFEVPQITEHDVQIYAYCSRVGNGSLTLMAVNHHSEDFEFDIKLTSKQHSAEVLQYVVTVVDGRILLNDEAFDFKAHLEPSAKVRPILKGLQLNIPSLAIAFWVVPNLNLRECFDDYQDLRTKVSRSVTVVENSVDQLLQELIAERAGQQDITQMHRRKRSVDVEPVMEDDARQLQDAKPKRGLKAKVKREPRQTLNYRLKERSTRMKEKRAERRQLKQQRRPLRERGKRQSRKRQRCANPSKLNAKKKTKRSSLAEAVNHPPVFGESYEEQVNRSSFPQGDVHLVISKGKEEEELSIEEAPIRQSRKKYRKKKTSKGMSSSEKDLRFVVPEVAYIRDQPMPRPELEVAESVHRQILLNDPEEATKQPKVYSINRELMEVSEIQEAIKTGVPIVKRQDGESDGSSLRDETEGEEGEEGVEGDEGQVEYDEQATDDGEGGVEEEENPEESNESLPDHSLGASPELGQSLGLSDEDMSEDSSEAYVEQMYRRRRRKRSVELESAHEEAFLLPSVNSTNLEQKFVEVFNQLMKSFNFGGASKENTAQEEQGQQRSKRNALLHPRSWESRERTNALHQQRTSTESRENMISTEQMREVQQIRDELAASRVDERSTTEVSERNTTTSSQEESDRPGLLMMRTVSQLVKSVSTEISRVLSMFTSKNKKQKDI
ncbi:uncharacterized protein LOC134285673 isoform X2 [Aedes albopictus]|uniref:Secreted protein n=1 Tax=Aedes albopictus TaxID=7160 RepID=A0ABM1ZKT4_AEDAL|nr:hypothetical protein RP20_CCG011106 [Aedes albopictus]